MELIAIKARTSGYEEFIIVNIILIKQHGFLLIIESKKSAIENIII